jgi:hypothetical protein
MPHTALEPALWPCGVGRAVGDAGTPSAAVLHEAKTLSVPTGAECIRYRSFPPTIGSFELLFIMMGREHRAGSFAAAEISISGSRSS